MLNSQEFPPEAAIPTKSAELVMNYHQVSHHHPSSHVVPNDTSDDKSIATNDYNAILPPHHRTSTTIPQKIYVQPSTTSVTTVSSDSQHAIPFLLVGS